MTVPFIWWQHYQHYQLSQLWFQKAVDTRLLVSLLTLLPRKILQHCVLFVWTAWEGSLPKQIPCLVQDHVSNRREPANRIGIELPVLSPSSFEKEQCLKASFSTRQADQLIALKKHGPAPASHHLKWVHSTFICFHGAQHRQDRLECSAANIYIMQHIQHIKPYFPVWFLHLWESCLAMAPPLESTLPHQQEWGHCRPFEGCLWSPESEDKNGQTGYVPLCLPRVCYIPLAPT